mgnify:CR=1 FL=1
MNDDYIMACIEFAKGELLACADDAEIQYKNIRKKARVDAWQEIEDWAISNGFILIAERAKYLKNSASHVDT